jgi:hypothetical protein
MRNPAPFYASPLRLLEGFSLAGRLSRALAWACARVLFLRIPCVLRSIFNKFESLSPPFVPVLWPPPLRRYFSLPLFCLTPHWGQIESTESAGFPRVSVGVRANPRTLKDWAFAIAWRSTMRKARVALARRLGIITRCCETERSSHSPKPAPRDRRPNPASKRSDALGREQTTARILLHVADC